MTLEPWWLFYLGHAIYLSFSLFYPPSLHSPYPDLCCTLCPNCANYPGKKIMSQPGKDEAGRVQRPSAFATALLIIIQLTSRLFTFAANQLILCKLSPATLGIATQLELYLNTTLYFSRESIRIAIQRQPLRIIANQKHTEEAFYREIQDENLAASQSVVNISYLSLAMGFPFAIILTIFYMHFTPHEAAKTPHYETSVIITGVASLLELGSEPFFAIVQQHMLYKKRAVVEMSAAFMKSFIVCSTFAWAIRVDRDIGVFPFALGHLGYSLTLIGGYAMKMPGIARKRHFSLFPTRVKSRYATTIIIAEVNATLTFCSKRPNYLAGRFSYQLLSLSANAFFQSAVKHLLTQGDSMVLATMSSLEDQGIYALASNYGGLVARIIFQPIEESSRTLFASLLSPREGTSPDPSSIRSAKTNLTGILRAYGLLSIIIFPFAPFLVPPILHLLGGRRWTSLQDNLLTTYCYYIPFMAFNGITEAFVSSAASPVELRRQTRWMGAFSASFIFAAYVFLKIGDTGPQGLVWANIVNMIVRTVWSYFFIDSYLRQHQNALALVDFCPRISTQIVGIMATAIMITQPKSTIENLEELFRMIVLNGVYALIV